MARYTYGEGSVFLVPLRTGGFARGIVARCDGRGLVFGYFFGPRLASIPPNLDADALKAGDVVLLGQFGDIGLRNGEWPVVTRIRNWRRESWPMPRFRSSAEHDNFVTLTEYDDDTLDAKNVITRPRCDVGVKSLPVDQVMGYGAVEKELTKRLEEV